MAWFAFGPIRRIFRRCGSDLVCACYSEGINKKDTEGKEYSPSALIRLERFMDPPGIHSRLDIASRRPDSTTSVVRVLIRERSALRLVDQQLFQNHKKQTHLSP